MKCIICNGEDIETREVLEEISIDADVVRFPVQAQVCCACGERYYDRRTVRMMEDIERTLRSGGIPLRQAGRVLVEKV